MAKKIFIPSWWVWFTKERRVAVGKRSGRA
jgi:hypothetical protein